MTLTWPIVGRGDEVALVLRGLDGGVGTVVVGEAGVGKTVLAREVRHQLDEAGWQTHLVLCSKASDYPWPALALAAAAEGSENLSPVDRLKQTLGSDEKSVLVVDDAHLLDDESAELLWRLVGGGVQVVATVRSGERTPDRVARLWIDGLCERLDLTPLTEEHVGSLLEAVLGGDVDDRLTRHVIRRAQGNGLLLRELVRSGIDSGAIDRSHEVWRLARDLPVGTGVAGLIRGHLAGLDTAERSAAELLAISEPLPLATAERAIGQSLMEALEEKRILALEETIDGPLLTLAHPLYGEVLRADIAPLRLRRLRLDLIRVIDLAVTPNPHDALRSALWRAELGEVGDPEELLAAARLARPFSLDTTEFLARAALAAGSPVEAPLLLAETLIMQGRVAEADRLLDGLASENLSNGQRRALIYARVLCRTRLGEVGEAAAMITGAAAAQAEEAQDFLLLQAVNAQALSMDGRMDEATSLAQPLFADPSADDLTRSLAGCVLVVGAHFVGRTDQVEQLMRQALRPAEAARAVLPYGVGTLMVAATIALAGAGELRDAQRIARDAYDRALADDDGWTRPRGASALGVTALMRGQPRTATRYFRITVASLNEFDGLFLCYNLSFLARGAALAGFVDEARRALQPAPGAARLPIFEADWVMAEAGLLAAEGALDAAADRALLAARHAVSLGQWTTVGRAAHDAARYAASPEAALLTAAAAERVDGLLTPCASDYARGRISDDPTLLAATSLRFEAMGTMVFAAEAACAAARGYRVAGDSRAAAAAAVRAGSLLVHCENAHLPWVAGFQSIEALTRREQQVALLAAAGRSDAAIAAALAVSIRTIQSHLARAYRKLGVTSRHDLPEALATHQ